VREVNLPSQIEVLPSQTLIKTWELTNSGKAYCDFSVTLV
jgi:hypothetical protein